MSQPTLRIAYPPQHAAGTVAPPRPRGYQGRHRETPSIVWPVTAVVATIIAVAVFITVAFSHPAGASQTSDAAAPASQSVTSRNAAATFDGRDWVIIEDHTYWAWWPIVRANTSWADNLAYAWVRYGTCDPNYRCIRVYEATVRNEWAAVTYINWWANWYTEIYVNPQRNWYSYARRDHIVKHELAHAFCLPHHSSYYNLMYAYVTTYNNLDAAQRSTFYNCN